MPLLSYSELTYQQAPQVKNDLLPLIPFIDGGHPSAIRPYPNLTNRYFVVQQAKPVGRTNPPIKAAISPVTLDKTGFGRTYRLSDESLRQYSIGAYLANVKSSYYQTRQQ